MNLKERQLIIGGIILAMTAIFIGRLAQLQLTEKRWSEYAGRITEESEVITAARGLILDRNGAVMLTNIASYDVLFTPRQATLAGGLDTLGLCQLLEMDLTSMRKKIAAARKYAPYRPSSLIKQVPAETHAGIARELWRFPGLQTQRRPIRTNPSGLASQLLGEFREVDREDLESESGYSLGDYKGKSGIELQWESELRGKKGRRYHIVDVRNDFRKSLAKGKFDTMPVSGDDITLTIDTELQAYAEKLMIGKRGAVVAIEPSTGEVLAIVSAPTYSTDLLTGIKRGVHYDSLLRDTNKPLFNRTVRATYRPGSIFKMIQGLIGLETGAISVSSRIDCNRNIIGCHGAHSRDNLREAIMHSCNPFFHETMRRMIQTGQSQNHFEDAALGMANWHARVKRFGFGTDLGGHLPGLRSGSLPDGAFYDRLYGSKRWAYSTIYSISIGEGELLTTPVHMANLAAIIANRGWYRTPHAIRSIGSKGKPGHLDSLISTGISENLFVPVVDAMQAVVESPDGTGIRAQIPGIKVCGKTGTVQEAPRANHSVFMAFAPRDNPQIAISVYVENAGSGGEWAAPIAGLILEKYLRDSVTKPDLEWQILNSTYPFPEFGP